MDGGFSLALSVSEGWYRVVTTVDVPNIMVVRGVSCQIHYLASWRSLFATGLRLKARMLMPGAMVKVKNSAFSRSISKEMDLFKKLFIFKS